MRRVSCRGLTGRLCRPASVGLVLAAILIGAMGLDCDSDAAAVFRQQATSGITSGVKTILDATVDGIAAAIQQAGDGTASTSS